ncbi:MAG TPA: hypothetical protein EYP98_03250, partial [Planctomycetes bacterium]|nr:hypothetical protein [Planctomycetota bacterium]
TMGEYQKYAKIPIVPLVVRSDDTAIQDSTPILEALEAEHPKLLTDDSPTQRVGTPLPKGGSFATQEHLAPMGSLESLMQAEEVGAFVERARKLLEYDEETPLTWSCEPKLDGVSANLLYEDGVLVRGLSRGDGQSGE